MARLALLLALLTLPGCAVFGGAGTATVSDGRIDARGTASSAGIGASGPYVGTTSGRVVVD
ncbi:MAG: hypothetical protein IBJ07_09835 [Rhizobiaceae bacterium]|nr:hypothetical protein [Rhizobiaceae bacterium]